MSSSWRSREHKVGVDNRPDTTRSDAGSEAASTPATTATRAFSGSSSLTSAGAVYGAEPNSGRSARQQQPQDLQPMQQRGNQGSTANDVVMATPLPGIAPASPAAAQQHRAASSHSSAGASMLPAINNVPPPSGGTTSSMAHSNGFGAGTARFCVQCGTMLVPDGRFCASCGAAVVMQPPSHSSPLRNGPHGSGSQSARVGGPPRSQNTPRSARQPASHPPRQLAPSNNGGSNAAPAKNAATAAGTQNSENDQAASKDAHQYDREQGGEASSEKPRAAKQPADKAMVALANASIGSNSTMPAKQAHGGANAAAVGSRLFATSAEPKPLDPMLCSVAKRMVEALEADYHRRGVHHGVKRSWSKFFSEVDADNSGRITLEELDGALRVKLGAKVSRFELRVFWRHVDADGSGLATKREFIKLMYQLDLQTWADIPEEEIQKTVTLMNGKAEQYHRAGGNWFKVFNSIDGDQRGQVTYDDLLKCVRMPQPGLALKEREIPELTLKGFWKALDTDGDHDVPVHKFIIFMRKHGAAHSMHKPTSYSKKKRGIQERKEEFAEVADASAEHLRALAQRLEGGLQAFYKEKGILANTHCAGGNWDRFFHEVDADGSGRLAWGEFSTEVLGRLSKYVLGAKTADNSISPEDLRRDLQALWKQMDPDGSGEVTAKELSLSLYQLEMEAWPEPNEEIVAKVVNEISQAAQHFHRAGGNWYKVFVLMDADGQGEIKFDDLRDVVRGKLPFLQIPQSRLSDADLKAYWKGLDVNMSGTASGKEFMQYMRKNGGEQNMHRPTKKRGNQVGRDLLAEIAAAPDLDDGKIRDIAGRLGKALHMWLATRGITGGSSRSSLSNPRLWGELFATVDTDKSGRLSFTEFDQVIRTVLRAGKMFNPDELKAFWKAVDGDGSGEVTLKEFATRVYKLQIEVWPDFNAEDFARIVSVMDTKADRLHRCSGNWYKVFSMIDADGTGEMEFDELVDLVRKNNPCLALTRKEVSDDDLRGLWKAADDDRSGKVTTKEFFALMRKHGNSMHKTIKQQRGDTSVAKVLPDGEPPKRSEEQLQAIAKALEAVTDAYWAKRGVHDPGRIWERLFKEADTDGSSRLGYFELENTLRDRMCSSKMLEANPNAVVKGVERGDLYALWARVDTDRSGEVTGAEWKVGLYRIQIKAWPHVSQVNNGQARLSKTVDVVHEAAERHHRAGGNWFKVFRMVAENGSEKMEFDELRGIIRRPLPCLAIGYAVLSEEDIQMLWRAMDEDESGTVLVAEFMRFMRSNGTKKQLHDKLGSQRQGDAKLRVAARAASATAAFAEASSLVEKNTELLRQALSSKTEKSVQDSLSAKGASSTGSITEWNFHSLVRQILKLGEDKINDDALYALWRSLNPDDNAGIPIDSLPGLGK